MGQEYLSKISVMEYFEIGILYEKTYGTFFNCLETLQDSSFKTFSTDKFWVIQYNVVHNVQSSYISEEGMLLFVELIEEKVRGCNNGGNSKILAPRRSVLDVRGN